MFFKKVVCMVKERNGSYTVEAAFVVPIVIGLAFTILYTLFLQHDRVNLQANLANALFLAAESDKDCMQDYESCFRESLWCMKIKQAEVTNGTIWIRGSVTAESVLEIPVLSYFMAGKQKFALSEAYCKIHPEEVIRFGIDDFKKEKQIEK